MRVTNAASKFLLVLILSLGIPFSQESRHRAYEEYMRRYRAYKKMYYGQFRPQRIRGTCQFSPHWTPVNGNRNPVYEKVDQGFIVVLYLINRRCKICYHELKSLHLWADYYRMIKKKVAIIALNRRGNPYPQTTVEKFPYINIYEEPRNVNIFKKLNGRAGDLLIYDKCGRRQYFFRYPYSSLVQSFVRNGIRNVRYHADTLCGKCSYRQKETTTHGAKTPSELIATGMLTTMNVPTTWSTSSIKTLKHSTPTLDAGEATLKNDIQRDPIMPHNEPSFNDMPTTTQRTTMSKFITKSVLTTMNVPTSLSTTLMNTLRDSTSTLDDDMATLKNDIGHLQRDQIMPFYESSFNDTTTTTQRTTTTSKSVTTSMLTTMNVPTTLSTTSMNTLKDSTSTLDTTMATLKNDIAHLQKDQIMLDNEYSFNDTTTTSHSKTKMSKLITTTMSTTMSAPTTLPATSINRLNQSMAKLYTDFATLKNDIAHLQKDQLMSDNEHSFNDVKSADADVQLSKTDISSSNNGVNSSDIDTNSSNNDVTSATSETTYSSEYDVVTNSHSASLTERKLHRRVLLPAYALKEILGAKGIPTDFLIHDIDGPYD